MELLGKVSQISKHGLIVKVSQLPKLGKKVFDDKGNFVGTVQEFFGNTKEPYVVIKTHHPPAKFDGQKMYL